MHNVQCRVLGSQLLVGWLRRAVCHVLPYEVTETAASAAARCTTTFRYDSYQCIWLRASLKGIAVGRAPLPPQLRSVTARSQVTLHRLMPTDAGPTTDDRGPRGDGHPTPDSTLRIRGGSRKKLGDRGCSRVILYSYINNIAALRLDCKIHKKCKKVTVALCLWMNVWGPD